MEVFNVITCLDLMGVCCEGKSDLAEIKCMNEMINIHTALELYENSSNMWPFKSALLRYVRHVYLDSANPNLFQEGNSNATTLRQMFSNIRDDMILIQEDWNMPGQDVALFMPDGSESSLSAQAKVFALDSVSNFMRELMRNDILDIGIDMFPIFHEITTVIAKMYYNTDDEDLKASAMDVLRYIN